MSDKSDCYDESFNENNIIISKINEFLLQLKLILNREGNIGENIYDLKENNDNGNNRNLVDIALKIKEKQNIDDKFGFFYYNENTNIPKIGWLINFHTVFFI